jgi:hypothetical protein
MLARPTTGREPGMTEPPPGQGPEPPKLPLVEAAVRLGKTTEAVRSMVRRGRLSAVKGNDGRLLVAVPPELDRAAVVADDDRSEPGARPADEQLARLLAERDEALLEADHLREMLRDALVARAEARARREAEAAAKDALIEELKAMLAEARRPWWRRFVGK